MDLLVHTVINKKSRSSYKPVPDIVLRFDCVNKRSIDQVQKCTLLVLENFQRLTTHERLKQILNSPKYWPMLKKIEFVPFIEPDTLVVIDMFSNLYQAVSPYIKDYIPLPGSKSPPIFVVPKTDEGTAIKEALLTCHFFCRKGKFLHYPWLGKDRGQQRLIVSEWNDQWYGKKVQKVVFIINKNFYKIDHLVSEFQRLGKVEILLIPPSFKYKIKPSFRIKNGKWVRDFNLVELKKFKLVFREDRNFIQSSETSIDNISSHVPSDLLWVGEGVENKEQIVPADLTRVDSF